MVFYVGYIISNWNEKKYKKFLDEGRGSERGNSYKPWLTVPGGPKEGRCSQKLGWKTDRIHHLFSDNETNLFFIGEWSPIVTDIREQYPLLDYRSAMKIAEIAGITYPVGKDGFPYILTTDLVFTITKNGVTRDIARAVKPEKELEDPRVRELLEIEKRYWRSRNVDWDIVLDTKMNRVFCANVNIVHPFYQFSIKGIPNKNTPSLLSVLKYRLSTQDGVLFEICSEFDYEMGFSPGTGLSFVKHLIARKEIIVDMLKPFDTFASTSDIKVVSTITERTLEGGIRH